MLRRPLNGLTPRTVREAARDPFDWIERYTRPRFDPADLIVIAFCIAASLALAVILLTE